MFEQVPDENIKNEAIETIAKDDGIPKSRIREELLDQLNPIIKETQLKQEGAQKESYKIKALSNFIGKYIGEKKDEVKDPYEKEIIDDLEKSDASKYDLANELYERIYKGKESSEYNISPLVKMVARIGINFLAKFEYLEEKNRFESEKTRPG